MQYPYIKKGTFKASKQGEAANRKMRPHSIRIGSLCTGYGGLDMAVQKVLGGRLAWVADCDRRVSKLLATRFPGIPNLGDLSAIDWRKVDPVDIVCAGFPCQDISYAGRGAGIAHCVGDS